VVLHEINISDPVLAALSGYYNVCFRVCLLDVKIAIPIILEELSQLRIKHYSTGIATKTRSVK